MSSPILPVQGLSGPSVSTPISNTKDAGASMQAFVSELATSERSLASEAAQGGPPPAEVIDQIAAAGRIEEQLRENGNQLRFSVSAGRGPRVTIELLNTETNTVRSMSAVEAIQIAAGGPLE
jgi:hypothetical protein